MCYDDKFYNPGDVQSGDYCGVGQKIQGIQAGWQAHPKRGRRAGGVSLVTLRQFENGNACNINMGNFLALLRVADCLEQMDELLPEIPVSAYVLEEMKSKKPKRVRHGK